MVPQAFGRFQNNLTIDCVCNECNQFFGDNLELIFNRDSWDAINRYKYGLKSLDELQDIRYRNVSLTYSGPGERHGVRLVFFNQNGEIVLDLVPQIGIREKNGGWVYFTLREIEKLDSSFIENFETKGTIKVFTKTDEEYDQVIQELRRLNIKFQKKGDLENLELDKEFRGKATIHYEMNNTIVRTVAKIGFNYLAAMLGPMFALKSDFDRLRNFILTGTESDKPIFNASNRPILIGDTERIRHRLGHVVVLEWGRGHLDIVCSISLFNDITYLVVLSRYYSGIYFDLRHGHFYNLDTMSVEPLFHTDKRLL